MLHAEHIQKNWENHLKLVKKFISKERQKNILKMYKKLEEIIVMSPASGKEHYHNPFPGGYVDHVNRVVFFSLQVKDLWEQNNANINFSTEELVFSALMHDIGKIGDGEQPGYVPQEDKWRKEKLGELYNNNEDLDFMLIQDRSLYLLNKFSIPCTLNEFIAIKTHDGLYDDTNKPYYISYKPESKFRSNLPLILHQADLMASKIELDLYNKNKE